MLNAGLAVWLANKKRTGGSLLAGCPVWNPGDPSANMPEAIGVEGEGRTGVPRGLCSLVTAKRAASAGGLPWQLYLIPTTMPEYPSPYHHLPPILTLSHTRAHTHKRAHARPWVPDDRTITLGVTAESVGG